MTEKRLLALLGFLLGLIAAILVLVGVLTIRGNQELTLEFLVGRAIELALALGLLAGSLLLFRGKHSSGGLVNLILGLVVILVGAGTLEGILGVLSGVLGLVAGQTLK
jgi:hypothetical protein